MLSFVEQGKTRHLATTEGFMEVHNDEVIIVTQTAEEPDEIDAARAKKSLEAVEAFAKTLDPHHDPVGWRQAQDKRLRALNRLAVARFATPEALRIQEQRAKAATN
jgi:F0F1-type ATP synthase epsilon subunit